MKRLFITLVLLCAITTARAATQLFSDNFESANPLSTNYTGCTSGTTPNGRVTISTAQAHSGTHSALYVTTGGDQTNVCYADLAGTSYHDFYMSIWMYFSSDFSSTGHGWRLYRSNASGAQFDEVFDATGANVEWDIDPIIDDTRSITFTDAFVFSRGGWVRMEFEFHQGTGANGTIRAWYTDGSGLHKWRNPDMTGLHHDCDTCSVDGCSGCHWTPTITLSQFALSTNVNAGTGGWYIDDIEIWDGCPTSGNYACVSGPDTAPPTRTAGAPTGTLPTGTTSTAITLTTDENATCKWSTSAGTAYASMTNTFTTTGGTGQSTPVSGLTNGNTYTYYVRCSDTIPNVNTTDYPITFSIASTPGLECSNWQIAHPTWIWCDDFEPGEVLTTNYADVDNSGGGMSLATDQAKSGTGSLKMHFTSGSTSNHSIMRMFGRNPYISQSNPSTDFTELYVRYFVRHQSPWTNPATGADGTTKMQRNSMFVDATWKEGMVSQVWNGNNTSNIASDPMRCASGTTITGTAYNDINGKHCSTTLATTCTSNAGCPGGETCVPNCQFLGILDGTYALTSAGNVGTWHCVETRTKLNTPGASDGISQTWIDGTLDSSSTTLDWRSSYTAHGMNVVALQGYWNGGAPATQDRWFDNLVISTTPIGCSVSGAPVCGDGVIDSGEVCDNLTFPSSTDTCSEYSATYCSGTLTCASNCQSILPTNCVACPGISAKALKLFGATVK